MTLIEAISCVPDSQEFTMTVGQLTNQDTDFDVTLTTEGRRWVILKGTSREIYAISNNK